MKRIHGALLIMLLVVPVQPAPAQQSTDYRLSEHLFNAGGHPDRGVILTSAGFRVTLDSIGDPLSASVLMGGSYRVQGGFISIYPPPGEVTGLAFTNPLTLVWDPEPSVGVYNLYRGSLKSLDTATFGDCLQTNLPVATATDSDPIPPGETGYFYLIAAENSLLEEGTKGFSSDGTPRSGPVCP